MLKRIVLTLLLVGFVAPPLVSGQAATQARGKQSSQQQGDMGAQLVAGLRQVDGCIGVDTCRWQSGKQSIVAWFKNKEAVVDWYYSTVHQTIMGGAMDDSPENEDPLKHVKDENIPIMVMATLTPSQTPELPGINIPIKQISIELFAALPGGAHVNGRASPKDFVVPHMRDYSPPADKSGDSKNGK